MLPTWRRVMHIHIPEHSRMFFSSTDKDSYWDFVSSPVSPDVLTPATPDHPLLAERPATWLDVELFAAPIMDIGNVLNLQTQAAHGVVRPQLNPVQKTATARKSIPSPPSSSNSTTSSAGGTPPPSAATRCTRCRRTVSVGESDANAVSFGSHIYYCGSCTRLLESRG